MSEINNHTVWPEKYRPTTLDSYVGNEHIKGKVGRYIASGDVPHLLLSGPAGTGKTTLAKIIVQNIDCDSLYINASDENSVDTVRNKIKTFASSIGFRPLKIVILDEADYITPNAQAALRNLMEEFSRHTRFILTCNYVERMIDPIVSRTQQFQVIPPSKAEVAKHVASILDMEEVTFDITDLKILIDSYYPDIRKILNECQMSTFDKELVVDQSEIIQSDYKLKIIDILASKEDKKKKFKDIRQVLADARIRDFAPLYRLLFDKVDVYGGTSVSMCILAIADGQFRDALAVDKEINFMGCVINVLQAL